MGIPVRRLMRLMSCTELVKYAAMMQIEDEETKAALPQSS